MERTASLAKIWPACAIIRGYPPPSVAKNSSALVTGGTGFLGRRLVERLLAEGRPVAVLARTPAPDLEARGVRFIRASLDDPTVVRAACTGIETVFHVAAKVGVWGRYEDFYRTNVLGTQALLEGCRAQGVARMVFTSTPSVVYNGRDLAGVDETLPLTTKCPSPYPLTKAIAEREVLAANSSTLRTIVLRPHLIWGVGDPHLVPRVLARARAGRLRIIGSGRNRVDLVHVENAVDAHLAAERALQESARLNTPNPATPENVCHVIRDKLAGVSGRRTGREACGHTAWVRGVFVRLRARGRRRFVTTGCQAYANSSRSTRPCCCSMRRPRGCKWAGSPPMKTPAGKRRPKNRAWVCFVGSRHWK